MCLLQHIDQMMTIHGTQIMQAVILILEGDHPVEVKEQVRQNKHISSCGELEYRGIVFRTYISQSICWFEFFYCCFELWPILSTPHCSSSLSDMNDCLAINSGYEYILCSMQYG